MIKHVTLSHSSALIDIVGRGESIDVQSKQTWKRFGTARGSLYVMMLAKPASDRQSERHIRGSSRALI